jgi:hypothetical protein
VHKKILVGKSARKARLARIWPKNTTILKWMLEYNKNTSHQQMHKESFIINRNTLLHVSTLLGHLQGELFCYRYTKVALYS